ncbi:sugar phosphate isomerase/epimerase family protein [Autumnicola psychrophila]|uniref:TIM barrel protein n=1 Tax=Autumnicola psychrophila TaxID=3075592 RepID=A0ABU3DN87_9FLAO|nr:TIM barrel protein [Zunongwangia sp. F225]MDT0684989.1 TIM barrel protein [Zunongwangia sp. F225]
MKNEENISSRRDFVKKMGATGLCAIALPHLPLSWLIEDKFEIGATFILWGYGPDNLEPALTDLSKLGYHSFETFGNVIQEYDENRGGIESLIDKTGMPITSAFCMTDVLDPSKRKEELEKLVKWSKLLKKAGGKVVEYCPSSINRKDYNYKDHKKNIVESMNDYAKAVTDLGLVCALHPHTGTPIETEEEVYFIMENVNTEYMKFGPDVGQLEKGGADPVKICNDFMSLIEHVHLKDYEGGDNGYLGYAPLGEGQVNIREILNQLEKEKTSMAGAVMFELDYDGKLDAPYSPFKAAKISRDYLVNLGYKFV